VRNGLDSHVPIDSLEIGDLIRRHVAAYPVDLERYFKLVVFNYLVNNGDAHTKNFSLIRNEQTGEYNLSPAYDLLNTRLHLPTETHTALDLFKDDFATESYKANAFYAYDDFAVFARALEQESGQGISSHQIAMVADGALWHATQDRAGTPGLVSFVPGELLQVAHRKRSHLEHALCPGSFRTHRQTCEEMIDQLLVPALHCQFDQP
jgi:hypothetical protein